METKLLRLKGIQRNLPAGSDDSVCDERINMRFADGAWRPMGKKELVKSSFLPDVYQQYFIHRVDAGENWIGWDGLDFFLLGKPGAWLNQPAFYSADNLLRIVSLKNFLILVLTDATKILLWSNGSYKLVDTSALENLFEITMLPGALEYAETEMTDSPKTPEAVLGKYYKKINELSKVSKHTGAVLMQYALRLFDGSYILHSVPRVYHICDYEILMKRYGVVGPGGNVTISFHAAEIQAYAGLTASADIDTIKNIVSSIDLFFSPVIPFFQIDEDTITDDLLDNDIPNAGDTINGSEFLPVDKRFREMLDTAVMYKVGSIATEKFRDFIPGTTPLIQFELDLEEYYSNYATKRTLPIDNYTHHASSGTAPLVYNSRLWLGNTRQVLGDPVIKFEPRYRPLVLDGILIKEFMLDTAGPTYNFRVEVDLATSVGSRKVVSLISSNLSHIPVTVGAGNYSPVRTFFLNGFLGYFDDRATNIKVFVEITSVLYPVLDKPLTKSMYVNDSYLTPGAFAAANCHAHPTFLGGYTGARSYAGNHGAIEITFYPSEMPAVVAVGVENNVVQDLNNVQVSEVSNPLVFKAENYQQVGESAVEALGTNVDPISTSQFGQYPVYVFTQTGIKALEVGTSGVVITRVVPLNEDVILSGGRVKNAAHGSLYTTRDGLKILIGQKDSVLSDEVEGLPDQYFIDNQQLQYFLNLPQTVNVAGLVDKIPFDTFLEGAEFGYCKSRDSFEIYVTNRDYSYSYVMDIVTKMWYKRAGTIYQLVDHFPSLLAVTSEGMVDLSKEVDGNIQMYFHTRPMSLGASEAFKKLRRTFLRSRLNMASGKYASFYIFSSDDLEHWEFQCGNDQNSGLFKDIWITHSWTSSRYYIFVFAAEVAFGSVKDNYVKEIEFIESVKWTGNLR